MYVEEKGMYGCTIIKVCGLRLIGVALLKIINNIL